jgi:hypothetical protein
MVSLYGIQIPSFHRDSGTTFKLQSLWFHGHPFLPPNVLIAILKLLTVPTTIIIFLIFTVVFEAIVTMALLILLMNSGRLPLGFQHLPILSTIWIDLELTKMNFLTRLSSELLVQNLRTSVGGPVAVVVAAVVVVVLVLVVLVVVALRMVCCTNRGNKGARERG